MDTHVQTAAGSEAGSPPEAPGPRRLKRAVPALLALLILTPGVLLAQPLKNAFADWVVGQDNPKAVLDMLQGSDGGLAVRRGSYHPHQAAASTTGGATRPLASASAVLPRELTMVRFTTPEAAPALGDDQTATMDEDNGRAGRNAAQSVTADDLMSHHAFNADLALGSGGAGDGGAGDGGFGSGGAGQRGGGSGGLSNSTVSTAPDSGADPLGADPSQLGATTPEALSGAPEPAAWVSMILGFGLIGSALRRGAGQRQPA